MFGEITRWCVEGAIDAETISAIENYGGKYSSLHEGYAVLKEEFDEVRDEYLQINNNVYDFWRRVKANDRMASKADVEAVRLHAEKMALEAVQVCAVCNKILKGI